MNIRIAQKKDAPALVEFNQAMALETEGKQLDYQILRGGVEARAARDVHAERPVRDGPGRPRA